MASKVVLCVLFFRCGDFSLTLFVWGDEKGWMGFSSPIDIVGELEVCSGTVIVHCSKRYAYHMQHTVHQLFKFDFLNYDPSFFRLRHHAFPMQQRHTLTASLTNSDKLVV